MTMTLEAMPISCNPTLSKNHLIIPIPFLQQLDVVLPALPIQASRPRPKWEVLLWAPDIRARWDPTTSDYHRYRLIEGLLRRQEHGMGVVNRIIFPNVAIWVLRQIRLERTDLIVMKVEMIARDKSVVDEKDLRDRKLVIRIRPDLSNQMILAIATLTFSHTGILHKIRDVASQNTAC